MKIALTQRILYHNKIAYDSIEHGWYNLLKDHTLFLIPNTLTQDFDSVAQNYDGLIITGGDDSALRRTIELKVASAFMKQIKPILGVCHGAFLLTDVLDGKLEEDINHRKNHSVHYRDNDDIAVNSYHSNIISVPPPTATCIVQDDDGNCESWVDNNIVAVVWHPERMEIPWLPEEVLTKFPI